MVKNKKILIPLIIAGFIIIIGIIFGTVDYFRIKNDKYPIFCIKTENRQEFTETWWGLGYKIQRELTVETGKSMRESTNLRFGLWLYTRKVKFEVKKQNQEVETDSGNYLFTFNKITNCSNQKKLYYTDSLGRNYYLNCLDDVIVNFDNKSVSLKDAFTNKDITIEKIINNLTYDVGYYDGGTSIYKDGGSTKYSNNGFSVLKCHTLGELAGEGGNRDIYIGPLLMSYEENFCDYDIKPTYNLDGHSNLFGTRISYSNKTNQLLIATIIPLQTVDDIDELILDIYYNDSHLFSSEYNEDIKKEYSIAEYLDELIISKNIKIEQETLKDSLKINIKYCIKDNCKTETMKLSDIY